MIRHGYLIQGRNDSRGGILINQDRDLHNRLAAMPDRGYEVVCVLILILAL